MILFVVSMLVFSSLRVVTDRGNIGAADSLPADDFSRRYAANPIPAYLHIGPGVLYLLLAVLQVSGPVRRGRLGFHRAAGRVAAGAGVVSAVFAVVFGVLFPWGGVAQATASVVFGIYFGVALALGVAAARRRDVVAHRRWMLRAFAVALGVATIRVILSLGEVLGVFTFDEAFGWSFWAGFVVNAVIVEAWLARWPRPTSPGRRTGAPAPAPTG